MQVGSGIFRQGYRWTAIADPRRVSGKYRHDCRTVLRRGPNLRRAAAGHGQPRRCGNNGRDGPDPFIPEMAGETIGTAAVGQLSVFLDAPR